LNDFATLDHGLLALQAGDPHTAAQSLRVLCVAEPDNARAHFLLGAALHAQDALDEAAASFDAAAEPTPADPEVFNALAVVLYQAGNLDRAWQAGQQALALAPNDPQYLTNLGTMLEKHAPQQALDLLDRALTCAEDPFDPPHPWGRSISSATLG
jgi:Flp pilus assembly protein TadD